MQFIDTTFSSVVSAPIPSDGTPGGRDQESCSKTPGGGTPPADFLLTKGGIMNRFLIAFILCLGAFGIANTAQAQWIVQVSGYLNAGQERILHSRVPNNSALDTIYQVLGSYNVAGTLRIQEGAEVQFLPNSRIIDSTGGKIIANGFTGQQRRILLLS